jgi:hypothetical protein
MREFIANVGVVLIVTACGTVGEDSNKSVAVGETQEALSNHEQCDTAMADHSVTGGNFLIVTSRVYGSASCTSGYLTDVELYRHVVPGPPEILVSWDDTVPTDQVSCEHAYVAAYAWDATRGLGIGGAPGDNGYLGALGAYGVWANGACTVPVVALDHSPLAPVDTASGAGGAPGGSGVPAPSAGGAVPSITHSYRYATTARQYTSNNSSYSRRSMDIFVR